MHLLNEKLQIDVMLVDLRQHHIEDFGESIKLAENAQLPRYRGEIVKCAIKSGWIASPEMNITDIANMKHSHVKWLSDQIFEIYKDALEISPKS